ncbi:MAG: rhodanese-like domain-containing protein [Vicinamibacteria bacterium]
MHFRPIGVVALVVAALLPVSRAVAASPRDSLVVPVAWLAQHLKDPDLVLLHVGDKAEYDASHIPGARFVTVRDLAAPMAAPGEGLTLEMPPADPLREKLSALGISDTSRVVVYFGKDWVSPSTRILFTLDYAGLGERASLLDGGQPAWVREGQGVTTLVPEVRPGVLSPLKVRATIVNADFVREHAASKGHVLIDARAPEFYDGASPGGPKDARRSGHIVGAVSVPFADTTNDDLLLRSPAELQARFAKAGVKPGDTVIAYCHIGQQATAVVFAARTLGYTALLYDGSFEDWARHDYPIDNPAAPKTSPSAKESR